jgi:hypothetical protein
MVEAKESCLDVMRHHRLRWPAWLLVMLVAFSTLMVAAAQPDGRWERRAPMPSSRSEVTGAEVGGRIIVVGGYQGERDIEIYDPAQDVWSRGAAFPHGVHHAAAAELGGKLYVFGGYVRGWTPSAEAYVYAPRKRPVAALAGPADAARLALGSGDRRRDPRRWRRRAQAAEHRRARSFRSRLRAMADAASPADAARSLRADQPMPRRPSVALIIRRWAAKGGRQAIHDYLNIKLSHFI